MPVLPELTSPRLRLRPAADRDLELMRTLNADEAVMRNLTGRPSTPEETEAEWGRRLGERSAPDRGMGYWTG